MLVFLPRITAKLGKSQLITEKARDRKGAHLANYVYCTGAGFNGRVHGFTRVDSARPVPDQQQSKSLLGSLDIS